MIYDDMRKREDDAVMKQLTKLLIAKVVTRYGKNISGPKDYEMLSTDIYRAIHENVSPSTLKRLMGYLPNSTTRARISTLNLLSQYIGYRNFSDFCKRDNVAPTAIATEYLTEEIMSIRMQMEQVTSRMTALEQKIKKL